MPERYSPDEMPADWRIKSFAHEKGFGTLVRESGEEALFDISAWDLGAWKPSRRDAAVTGPESPLLPKAGEAVRVRWRRSATGKNVPAQVQPTERTSPDRTTHKLGAWLRGVQRYTGKFRGVTPASLIEVLAKRDEDAAKELRDGEPRDAKAFAFLLMDLGSVADVDPSWASTHAGWIYVDDHRWDRERARQALPAMIGLKSAPMPADGEESLSAYVARCNAAALGEGVVLRLHEIALDGDAHVFVALPPIAFDALVRDGYLDVD